MTKRLGLVIDQERCIGCEACTVACKIEHKPANVSFIRVEILGGQAGRERYPDLRMDFLPRLCMQCEYPPCLEACPKEALFKRKDGPVVLDEEKCDGCQICVEVCPYQAVQFNSEKGQVEKCDFCSHRIDQGLEPFCVICCEGQAMHFGDLNDPHSEVSRLISSREGFQLNLEANTHPSVFYCPPRKRRRL